MPFIVFWQVWWPDSDHRLVFAHGDFVNQYYPWRVFVSSELGHGHLPLWDPYTYGGSPAVAAAQYAAFYPLGLWQVAFTEHLPFIAVEMEVLFHLSLAGLFTFLLVRRLTGKISAGLVGGIVFGLGGYVTSYPMLQVPILETAVWLPAGLWLLDWALSRRSLRSIIVAGTVLGVGLLAGHFQTFLYIAYACGGFLIVRAHFHGWGYKRTLAAAAILAVLTLGVGAAQWLPSLEMVPLSPRSSLSYEELAGGFRYADLVGLFRPIAGEWSPLYVGILPLFFAIASVLLWRGKQVWFWVLVAGLALMLSLGDNGFLYSLAHSTAPGFALFRHQERAAFLVSLSLAVLAGYGYAGLARYSWWPALAVVPILFVVIVDLVMTSSGTVLQEAPEGGYYATSPALDHLLQVDPDIGRISSEGLLPGNGNAGLVYDLRDVVGSSPLRLAYYDEFIDRVPELRWWRMLDVQYLITQRQLDHGGLSLLVEEGEQRLYQVFLGQRHAWVTHDYRVAENVETAIDMTSDPTLEPLQIAILEKQPQPLPQPAFSDDRIEIVTFERQRIVVNASLATPGILILSEVQYPGWRTLIDGKPAPALRAYGLLRAVALPAGDSQIEWHFVPLSVYVGLATTLSSILAGALAMCWRRETTVSDDLVARSTLEPN